MKLNYKSVHSHLDYEFYYPSKYEITKVVDDQVFTEVFSNIWIILSYINIIIISIDEQTRNETESTPLDSQVV